MHAFDRLDRKVSSEGRGNGDAGVDVLMRVDAIMYSIAIESLSHTNSLFNML